MRRSIFGCRPRKMSTSASIWLTSWLPATASPRLGFGSAETSRGRRGHVPSALPRGHYCRRVRLTLLGVRGSTPAPGPEFVRYGGHTSCIAVGHHGQPPSLILDSGTRIRRVTKLLDGQPFAGAILLGHLHWDHTQGLPFFGAGDHPGSEVAVHAPAQGDTRVVLERFMSPPHFPITPGQLRGSWTFHALEPGAAEIGGF